MRPISPSTNCNHQANTAYDKLAVISENMPKLLEIEQFIFELKQWLRAYIDAVRNNISEENFAKLTDNNVFTGINTFSNVHLHDGNIYWVDALGNNLAWISFDSVNQILTLHVRDSELTLSPNIAMTVPTDADIPNSIVTYSFLYGLLQELEERVTITKDTTITEGSNNVPTTDAVYQFVTANQFHLTLEDTVLENSSNGVKSSGIYAAIQALQEQIDTLTDIINQQEANPVTVFSSLGLEDGIYTATTYTSTDISEVNTYTLEEGHYYRLGINRSVTSKFVLSSDDITITRLYCVYPDVGFVSVFKPNVNITLHLPAWSENGVPYFGTFMEYTQIQELPSTPDLVTMGNEYEIN